MGEQARVEHDALERLILETGGPGLEAGDLAQVPTGH